jgi:K+-sensing histidine kinase KdpD
VSADATLAPAAGHRVSGPPDRRSDQVTFSRADKEASPSHQGPATRGQLRIYLSEIALRWVADKLAGDPQGYRADGQVRGSGHAGDRVVVALGGGPEDETLIRRAARIAERSGGDLLAVHAARPGRLAAARAALAAQRQLTRSLGGTYTSSPTPTSRPRC